MADESANISAWCTGHAATELLQISPDEFDELPEVFSPSPSIYYICVGVCSGACMQKSFLLIDTCASWSQYNFFWPEQDRH